MDSAHPLSSKLTKQQLAHLDAVAKQPDIAAGETALEPLRPWMAAISPSMIPMLQAGYDPNSGAGQRSGAAGGGGLQG